MSLLQLSSIPNLRVFIIMPTMPFIPSPPTLSAAYQSSIAKCCTYITFATPRSLSSLMSVEPHSQDSAHFRSCRRWALAGDPLPEYWSLPWHPRNLAAHHQYLEPPACRAAVAASDHNLGPCALMTAAQKACWGLEVVQEYWELLRSFEDDLPWRQ